MTIRFTVQITDNEKLGAQQPMIERLSRRMDAERTRAAKKWIADPRKISRMRKEALASITYRPKAAPFAPRVIDEHSFDGYVRQTLSLRINPDDRTEAYLWLPKSATRRRKAPGLLAIHEHGGQFLIGKESLADLPDMPAVLKRYQNVCYGGRAPGEFFASQGYAVLAIDLITFSSRAQWHPEDLPYHTGRAKLTAAAEQRIRLGMRYEGNWLHRALLVNGVTESEICIHDLMRATDFLASLPQVDSRRLGAFGLSVGSILCHYVAALDTRIRSSVRACWSGPMSDMLRRVGPRVLGSHFLLPGLSAKLHVPEWVALSYPRRVLILNGRKDSMYTPAEQEKTRRDVARYARMQGDPARVTWTYFDGPHCFHPPQQDVALRFFEQTLR